ncbi:hypothetical protein [Chryseobacterium indologenes]|uniref:Uncharacterized protein n=1 Tax=Chryseobacterium indologenes TaxID=253 RepID=A0A0N0ITR7_CHRID|nr:hypothetical protein [Chryseobacterium indologenes]KPE48974.1 hypothetical protein AOB46_22510 [Chryseobacterium indologenes]
MAGAMFQSIMSGLSSIDSILGGFNSLRNQIINAGLGSNPEKTQASFNDWEKLTDKVPELNKLFSKAPSVFIPVTGENYLGQQDPFTNRIRISTDKIGSLLEYAYTIGHEMLHVFDDKYNYKKYIDLFSTNDREFERNRYTIPIYMLFKEYRGYSWEKSLGKDVDVDRTMNAYRVRWALPQKTLDFLNSKIKFLSNLFINP